MSQKELVQSSLRGSGKYPVVDQAQLRRDLGAGNNPAAGSRMLVKLGRILAEAGR